MISSLRLKNFKNFADESIRFGPFTVIVGANAAGKSNIRDALRFLHGIGRNYTLAEIVGGKVGTGGQLEWEPIRGGANELIRFGSKSFGLDLEMQVDKDIMKYSIEVGFDATHLNELRVIQEHLWVSDCLVYGSIPDDQSIHNQHIDPQLMIRFSETESNIEGASMIAISRDKPASSQILESQQRDVPPTNKSPVFRLMDSLRKLRFFEPIPAHMKIPSFPRMTVLGDRGENLPTVLMRICESNQEQSFIGEWISELTPMKVTGFEFLKDPSRLIHLMVRDSDNQILSTNSISDGTLRFLFMLAIFFDQSAPSTYFFEEISRGIHPSKVQLLLNLIQEQSKDRNIQVVTTTHSSELLSMLSDEAFECASIVANIDEHAHAIIRPLADLHRIRNLRVSQRLDRLMTSGWMEDALAFTEGREIETERVQ